VCPRVIKLSPTTIIAARRKCSARCDHICLLPGVMAKLSFKPRLPQGWAGIASRKRWKINTIGATDNAGVKR
jgi:hypothetical protein